MKKSSVMLALFGAFSGVLAGAAQAQSSVQIYGNLDVGINKLTGTTAQIGKRDNNRLGFKGTEDLGDGLKALFQLEIRFDPDTGVIEGGTRPLFQGQSRVGLQGGFGTARLGRGLSAFQESILAFEPWAGAPTPAGFQTDIQVAGYTSDPLSPAGNSRNRFSNAFFYNTPLFNGFQLNATVASKEANNGPALIWRGTALAPQFAANSQAAVVPYSLSATYINGPLGAMAAYERNAVDSKLWSVAGSFAPITDLKLVASYQHQDQDATVAVNPDTKAWLVGANYVIGTHKLLAGYGQKRPDGVIKTKQVSLGYEYSLSKRTYLYADASNRKVPTSATTDTSINFYGLGVHHNF